MQVLLYCDDPGYGGTAVNAKVLCEGLVQAGFMVNLAATMNLAVDTPSVRFYPIDYDTQLLDVKAMLSRNEPEGIFLDARPDLVFFCDCVTDSSLAAKAVCRDWGIAYVIQANYVSTEHLCALGERFESVARAVRGARAVAAVSTENLQLLRGTFGLSKSCSGVVYNGRPDVWFKPPPPGRRDALRHAWGMGEREVVCLTVARYEPRKGYQYLLEAVAGLLAMTLPVRCTFVWIGQYRGEAAADLAATVAARGLGGHVRVLGDRKDVRDWLCVADMFLLPSESEGMPLCIVEAMGQGVPVVATAISGVPEQLGDAGRLVPDPRRDPQGMITSLIRAITDLAMNPRERRALGERGRRRALAYFTADNMIAGFAGLLRSLGPGVTANPPSWPTPRAYRPPHLVALGRDIRLGDSVQAAEYLKEGWSHGEAAGRWTDGARARLVFALPPECDDGYVLLLGLKPFLGREGRTLTVSLTLNGSEVGFFRWRADQADEDVVALAILPDGSRSRRAELVFSIDGASSPASLGLSDDARLLGARLSTLRLERLTAAGGGA